MHIATVSVIIYRSSRPEVFCKKGALKNFTKFTGNHLCQGLFFNKIATPPVATSENIKRLSLHYFNCT